MKSTVNFYQPEWTFSSQKLQSGRFIKFCLKVLQLHDFNIFWNMQDESKETVGQIHSLDPQGIINVQWPSGEITRCYPQELYIVGDEVRQIFRRLVLY